MSSILEKWNEFTAGEFAPVKRVGKTYLEVFVDSEPHPRKVTIRDVVRYYATEARNITSGVRDLAGIIGDWRCIDEIAHFCLEWFKFVNRKELEKISGEWGMTLRR